MEKEYTKIFNQKREELLPLYFHFIRPISDPKTSGGQNIAPNSRLFTTSYNVGNAYKGNTYILNKSEFDGK